MKEKYNFYCAAGSNSLYVWPSTPGDVGAMVLGVNVLSGPAQASTKTFSATKSGGNVVVSGTLDASAGVGKAMTMTTTDAYRQQVITMALPLVITLDLSGGSAGNVIIEVEWDEFKRTTV